MEIDEENSVTYSREKGWNVKVNTFGLIIAALSVVALVCILGAWGTLLLVIAGSIIYYEFSESKKTGTKEDEGEERCP